MSEELLLAAAALIAGAINAIAGGGTLLSFPALLYLGVPPVVANATNTLALFLGSLGGVYGFRRHLTDVRPMLKTLMPVSIIGSLLGSLLLTVGQPQTFARLAPWLVLFATVLFIAQGYFKQLSVSNLHPQLALVLQFLVAVYGGYFGAGIGILMLATLGLIGQSDLNRMNAMKNLLAAGINATAAVWFIVSGLIDWRRAVVMTVAAWLGYYLGAHYSQRLHATWVRGAVIVIGLGVALALVRGAI
jgi:uncharacterized protein